MKRYILHVVELVLHLLIIVAVTKLYYEDDVSYQATSPITQSISTDITEQGGTEYGF